MTAAARTDPIMYGSPMQFRIGALIVTVAAVLGVDPRHVRAGGA